MAAIHGRDTGPERKVRSGLHRQGFRFLLHSKKLPGRPDLVLPKFHAAIFINGCFWHGHDCQFFRWPGTRKAFWREKIRTSQLRDKRVQQDILSAGWRSLIIWECAIRGGGDKALERTVAKAAAWLVSRHRLTGTIRGK
jgi:DNA mismatch endonuclease (patch repair protein)